MKTATQTRQKVLAVFPAVSGVLLMIGGALTPSGLDQLITTRATALKMLPIAAAHTNQLFLSNFLVICGFGGSGSFVCGDGDVGARSRGTSRHRVRSHRGVRCLVRSHRKRPGRLTSAPR